MFISVLLLLSLESKFKVFTHKTRISLVSFLIVLFLDEPTFNAFLLFSPPSSRRLSGDRQQRKGRRSVSRPIASSCSCSSPPSRNPSANQRCRIRFARTTPPCTRCRTSSRGPKTGSEAHAHALTAWRADEFKEDIGTRFYYCCNDVATNGHFHLSGCVRWT